MTKHIPSILIEQSKSNFPSIRNAALITLSRVTPGLSGKSRRAVVQALVGALRGPATASTLAAILECWEDEDSIPHELTACALMLATRHPSTLLMAWTKRPQPQAAQSPDSVKSLDA